MHLKKAYLRFDAWQEMVMGLGNGQTAYCGGNVSSAAT
jgi:hypothetical protein